MSFKNDRTQSNQCGWCEVFRMCGAGEIKRKKSNKKSLIERGAQTTALVEDVHITLFVLFYLVQRTICQIKK